MENSLPLHLCRVQKSSLVVNRLHTFLHGTALIALIHYRASSLYQIIKSKGISFIIPYALIFVSELILSFIWLLNQAYRWRPVSRTVFPERLPEDDELSSIDVFICTADPNREPSVGVMCNVISAMGLEYPADKLHVYLSDDAGSSITLFSMKEAWKFARSWLPFCRKFGIKTRRPEAYFTIAEDSPAGNLNSSEYIDEKGEIKKQYDEFKDRVQKFKENTSRIMSEDHPPSIQVIKDEAGDSTGRDQTEMPVLVYVSREKRPSQPHQFKAGALNVLLRVSSMISNSPYILVLDCDMFCNDPTSARQAMCFYLDKKLSSKLAFVQFPQKFHNISENDIYDSRLRSGFEVGWKGFDGLKGPVLSGTCFYIKREALYGDSNIKEDVDFVQLRKSFGSSIEFIKSLYENKRTNLPNSQELSSSFLEEAQILASCTYENHTQWGKEVGFRYFSVAEDFYTSLLLHCKGWISVYLDPQRPAFLGSCTTNLSDLLVQNTRWAAGLIDVGISKYSPLLYGIPRMSILQSMCYAELAYFPLYFLPCWCLATMPLFCLLHNIPLYPRASNQSTIVFVFLFLSSNLKHIQEILCTGHSIWSWIYEQRMWMIKSTTCYLYGSLNAILEKIGAREATFLPTNKAADEEQTRLYQLGKFNFQVSTMFITPICTLVILNAAFLLIGVAKIISNGGFDEMIIQAFIPLFIFVIQYPVIEGMFLRKDKGRVPQYAVIQSLVFFLLILLLEHLLPMH